jgi:hypothetical protein
VITVEKLVCVIYGNGLEWTDQQQKLGQAKPRKPSQAKGVGGGGSIATPPGKTVSLSREGPIHMVLPRLAAQVHMSVIQQICNIAYKIE